MDPGQKAKKSRNDLGPPLLDSSSEAVVNVMDDEIWKEFPKDLLEDVTARLPIAAFIRFRLVCREWNSLLESQIFLKRLEEVARQNKPWFYCKTLTYGGKAVTGAMYDTYTKKWHGYPACTRYIFPSASAGGLVCNMDSFHKCFVVGNPVTQTWKKFSWSAYRRERRSYAAVGLVMYSGGYKIVCANRFGEFEVYDSLTNNNNTITRGEIPGNTQVKGYFGCVPPVTIDTVVYFLISNPDGILSLSEAWECNYIPHPPDSTDHALVECGGRILLVGLVGDQKAGALCVCVWELQRTMLAWMEIDRIPKSWCSDLSRHKKVNLRCVGNTGMFMVVLQTIRMNRILTYDAVNREWSQVPRFTLPGWKWQHRTDCGVVFYPSLSASP